MDSLYKNDKYPEFVQLIFTHVIESIFSLDYKFRVINRRSERQRVLGYINFRKKIIALDIFTEKKREPKSINALLRVIAHEIAHIQKPPYRQLHKGRFINRQHYPAFYTQVTKNVETIKKDVYLQNYFDK